jgi:hypothetical protein
VIAMVLQGPACLGPNDGRQNLKVTGTLRTGGDASELVSREGVMVVVWRKCSRSSPLPLLLPHGGPVGHTVVSRPLSSPHP